MKKGLIMFSFLMFVLMGCSTTKVIKQNRVTGKEYKLLDEYPKDNIILGFDNERFYGFSGVNNYFGNYIKQKDNIRLVTVGMTRMSGTPEMIHREKNYLDKLQEVNNYKLKGKELILFDDEKEVLKFEEIIN